MPLETGTWRFFANVDFTRCWAQKPSTIGMRKKATSAVTRTMVTADRGAHARAGAPITRVLNCPPVATGTRGVGERLLKLGLRLLGDVRVPERLDRRLELRQEGRELRRKPGELLEELPGAGVRRVVRSLREVVEAQLERADLLVELLLEVLAGLEVRRPRSRRSATSVDVELSASSSFSRKSSGVSVSPLTSASDVIEARQSPMSLHTASAHSAVDGDSSSVKRMTTAAMTIAATPITTAAMNQFLRTGERV